MMMKPFVRIGLLLLITALLVAGPPAAAQDDANLSPVLDLLALVPDVPDALGGEITFADYAAAARSRPGAVRPQTLDAFLAEIDEPGVGFSLYFASLRGMYGGARLLTSFFQPIAMQDALGFSMVDLDASLFWGMPPTFGEILLGDFDRDAVIAAHEARGWALDTEFTPGYEVLCIAAGCLEGDTMDIANREPFDLFGNSLGFKQPIMLLEDTLLSTRNLELILKTAAMLDGDSPSLADRPDFQTAVAAMGDEGALVQMWFLPPDMIELVTGLPVSIRPLEGAENPGTDDWADYPMPPVQLIAFAHIAAEDAEIARVALVYATEAEAQQAAANIPPRLDGLISLRVNRPVLEFLTTERDATLDDPVVFADPDSGLYAVVLTLRGPAPGDVEINISTGEPVEEPGTGTYRDSGLIFRPLVDFLYTRDTFWYALTPDDAPPED